MMLIIRAATGLLLLSMVACTSVNNDAPEGAGARAGTNTSNAKSALSTLPVPPLLTTPITSALPADGLHHYDVAEPAFFTSVNLAAQLDEVAQEPPPLISTLVQKPWRLIPSANGLATNQASSEPMDSAGQQTNESTYQKGSLWDRIKKGFKFSHGLSNKAVNHEIKKYSLHHRDFYKTLQRSEPFLFFIVEEAEKRSIPLEIALLPVIESAFNPFAYSPLRAAGIWQFIPNTGKYYGLKQTWWYDGRRDVIASTRAAFNYLNYLYDRFDRDWLLALAAYNAGSGTVSRAIRRNKKQGKPTDYWNLRLPRETKTYIPRLVAVAKIVSDPAKYGVTLHPIANQPVFSVVDVASQIDLPKAAALAGITVDDLFLFNPGFKQWATDPLGPHKLAIPAQQVEQFKTKLAALPVDERVAWQRYIIKPGDNLSVIANKHNISVAVLKDFNRLKSSRIRAGKALLIPNPKVLNNEDRANLLAGLNASEDVSRAFMAKRSRKTMYRVRKGDTLWDISRKFHVNTRKLAQWNDMAPSEVLRPGRKLTIWQQVPSGRPAGLQLASNTNNLHRIDYTVKNGDSLYRIANEYRVTIKDLLQWNTLSRRKFLQPGQNLNIYVNPANIR